MMKCEIFLFLWGLGILCWRWEFLNLRLTTTRSTPVIGSGELIYQSILSQVEKHQHKAIHNAGNVFDPPSPQQLLPRVQHLVRILPSIFYTAYPWRVTGGSSHSQLTSGQILGTRRTGHQCFSFLFFLFLNCIALWDQTLSVKAERVCVLFPCILLIPK